MQAFFVYMLTLGLATSLHCVSMCGPLVLTYAVKGSEDGPWYRKLAPNVAYQAAKVVSYVLAGLLVGWIGSFFNLDIARRYVMFLAGAFMIVLGLGMTGRVPWAFKLVPRPPAWLNKLLARIRRKSVADAAHGESHLSTPIALGLMTGLLPCGPLIAAEVAAATSGSALTGAVGMAAFALGTAPLMVAFGTAGSLIPRAWKERMMVALAIVVMLFGLVFINRGLMLNGLPNFNTLKRAVVGQPSTTPPGNFKTAADGVVEVPLVIENGQYYPATLNIPADKPVRIVVDRRTDNVCSDELVFPQLGVSKKLAPNASTAVDVPATKAGSYTMTCQMGMMSGTLVVGGGAGSTGGSVGPGALIAVALFAAGGVLLFRRKRVAGEARPAPEGAKPDTTVLGFTPREVLLVAVLLAAAGVLGAILGRQ